jgi:hypothetical protein
VNRLPGWALALPLAFGGTGLFLVAFVDASFFSIPAINDVLVVWSDRRQRTAES